MNINVEKKINLVANFLRGIYPANKAVLLGSVDQLKRGVLSELEFASIIVLDPDPIRVEKWHNRNEEIQGLLVSNHACATSSGEIPFFRANMPSESGLIQPEKLEPLWQNIATLDESQVRATTLDEISLETGHQFNWVFSEILNIADVLSDSQSAIEEIEVIFSRTITDPHIAKALPEYSKPQLDEVTDALGFVEVACLSNKHPKMATVIYVKDWKSSYRQATKRFESELISERAKARASDEELRSHLTQARGESNALGADLSKTKQALDDSTHELAAERDKTEALSKTNEALGADLSQTKQALADSTHELAAERDKSEALVKTNEALEFDRKEQTQSLLATQAEHRELTQDNRKKDQQLETLHAQHQELSSASETTISELRDKLAQNTASLRQAHEEIQSIKAAHRSVAQEYDATIIELRETLAKNDEVIERANAELVEKDRAISESQSMRRGDVERLHKEINSAQSVNEETASALAEALEHKGIAEKRLQLAENNLENLRKKQRALSDENRDQAERLSQISAHLAQAIAELESKTNSPPKKPTNAKRTARGKSNVTRK